MIRATASHTVHRRASREAVRRCVRILMTTSIFVGVPEGSAPRDGAEPQELTNAQLLFIQEHGVRRSAMRDAMQGDLDSGADYHAAYELYIHEHGSPLWQIPPRPVLAPAIAAAKGRLMPLYEQAVRDAWAGIDPTEALKEVGSAAAAECQAWFDDPRNEWPPNAPSTIREKGSSMPLIDTGQMRRAITYALRRSS